MGRSCCTRPARSKCSKALLKAEASTGSELRSCAKSAWLRLWVAVGGVLDSGGEMSAGVRASSTRSVVATGTRVSSDAIAMSTRLVASSALVLVKAGAVCRTTLSAGAGLYIAEERATGAAASPGFW